MQLGGILGLFIRVFSLVLVLLSGLVGMASAVGDTMLADAAEHRNTVLIRTLLNSEVDVNAPQVDGMTALHWAVYHDDAEMTQLLVESGADPNVTNRYGVPPLSLGATNGHAAIVRLLLSAGANVNGSLSGGETILMTASRTGSLEVVQALLATGADPNAREQRDQTVLMWAAAEGHAAIVRVLVDAGADIHTQLKSGFTPMFFAVREGHIDTVRTFLDLGVDVNALLVRAKEGQDPQVNNASYKPVDDGISPLLLAVRNGHFELAIDLVEAGADPNDQRTGFTPLHTMSWVRKPDASDRGDPPPIGSGSVTGLEFVRKLVAVGADVDARLAEGVRRPPHTASSLGRQGATPFLMAADRGDIAWMRVLIELGADPFLPNAQNTTSLMAAAGFGTTAPLEEAGTELEALEAVQLLLELGSDINAVNNHGDTAMHGAAFGNYPKVVKLLADSGADPEVWRQKNKRGLTPLFIAEGHRGGGFKLSRPDHGRRHERNACSRSFNRWAQDPRFETSTRSRLSPSPPSPR